MRTLSVLATLLFVAAACGGQPSASTPPTTGTKTDDTAAFYAGKTVRLVVGYTPGGGYDTYARLLAAHIGKNIPGTPTVIVENMDGAGSLKAANYLFTTAPKDGTVFGTFGRGLPASELLGDTDVAFKSTQFNWMGSMNDEVSVCVVRSDSKTKTFQDALTSPVRIGATGPDDDTGFFPRFLNGLIGAKFELKVGYPGGNDVNLAIERGEVDGRCGFSWSSLVSTRQNWLDTKFINILVQMSLNKHPNIPSSVPLIMEYMTTAEQKQLAEVVFSRQTMGRPYAIPPGVPEARTQALRDAFDKTMKDPAFLEDAKKAKQELNPKSGKEIQAIVEKIFQTPQAQRDKLKSILAGTY
ncbi:MAG: Bug family tripartite tricarboxylate transporter substrate binding protein [Candidatus Limnocylindria bacterium]